MRGIEDLGLSILANCANTLPYSKAKK